jgi:putative hydrolase of the HAD superfamily
MKKYQEIFFDLDHTLWDHDKNAEDTLHELYDFFHLKNLGAHSAHRFVEVFLEVNPYLWSLYEKNQITSATLRSQRFQLILERLGVVSEGLSDEISDAYLDLCPRKAAVFEGAHQVLDYLAGKYPLHLVTNGFDEMQQLKIQASGLTPYFREMFTSNRTGYKKPEAGIFHYSLQNRSLSPNNVIMVGDNPEADIEGAQNVGIDTIWFNPTQQVHSVQPTHSISQLLELKDLL